MTIDTQTLHAHLNDFLQCNEITDYCPNGLQVEGRQSVSRIVTGVTATQALIEKAIELNADALLVHHGYFWKGEDQTITGMKQRRIKALLSHGINLLAYHLPLDVHAQVGNNRQLGERLGVENMRPMAAVKPLGIVYQGEFAAGLQHNELAELLTRQLSRSPLSEAVIDRPIKTLAWCTGGGQGFIEQAAAAGVDAFVTGEVSEQTIHVAREMGIDFFSAGHHATERYGVKALGDYLAESFGLDVTFIDIPNPA
ncbi:Nif3-like dinuclear metal center hexameric protein [Alteromonas sp. CYL-A6]|uniref:Nif3-like dinuclear metal center hexameric protein n=1 Tax=Alteromonas nitratireducens TaxID=3390813 RepID=UPI0039837F75